MEPIISLKNLEFGYHHQQPILHIKDLSILPNEKVFLYGPSGCGKSTLLSLLAGIIKPSAGELRILGQDFSKISAAKKDKIRGENIGYIFQNFNLVSYLTCEENILLPLKIHRHLDKNSTSFALEEVRNLAQKLGLGDYLKTNITKLSVGQQQRVAAARALIGNPQLLIADEPTSSLDEANTKEFLELLLTQCQQNSITVVFVSHDQRLISYFDKTIFLPKINEV